jgi:Photosynthetic reaction centre cytochrome C subunit
MPKLIALALCSAVLWGAPAPDLTGVWKADLSQSKIPGPPDSPPPSNYLVIFEQKPAEFDRRTHEQAPLLTETTGVWGPRGEQRSALTVFNNGKPVIRPYQGVPTRLTATSQGNILVITGEVAGRSSTFTRTYKRSPDGQTLAVTIVNHNEGRTTENTLLLRKQPEAEGEVLRKPEELAQTRFKNVKTTSLKNLPASEFLNQMRYFAWSLNRNCEFCHVEHHFDSDDKKEKKTARRMIDMVASIDGNYFDGHPAVRCFTCHEGQEHPLSHPLFREEAAAQKAERDQAAAPRQHTGPGPLPAPSHP